MTQPKSGDGFTVDEVRATVQLACKVFGVHRIAAEMKIHPATVRGFLKGEEIFLHTACAIQWWLDSREERARDYDKRLPVLLSIKNADIRARLTHELKSQSLPAIAGDVGIARGSLSYFLQGGKVRARTLRYLREWYLNVGPVREGVADTSAQSRLGPLTTEQQELFRAEFSGFLGSVLAAGEEPQHWHETAVERLLALLGVAPASERNRASGAINA